MVEKSVKDKGIVLIGMPGVGKSTVGVVLAKMLGFDFVDADIAIQNEYGRTLQDLIDEQGSERFIQMEGDVLSKLDPAGYVISTGGSAVYSNDAMERFCQISNVVYLSASLDELAKRLSDFTQRGVVMRGECNSLKELYDERVPLYERYAQSFVATDGVDIPAVARRIIEAMA